MSENNEPSKASMRAAERIMLKYAKLGVVQMPNQYSLAQAIDEETGVKELVETLRMARAGIWWRQFKEAVKESKYEEAKSIADNCADIQEIDLALRNAERK